MWIVKFDGEVYATGFQTSGEAAAFVIAHQLRAYGVVSIDYCE